MPDATQNGYLSVHQGIRLFFKRHEFLLLLLVVLGFLLLPSFFTTPVIKNGVIYSLLVLVLFIGVLELSDSKHLFFPAIVLAILVIGFNSFNFSLNTSAVFLVRMGSLIAFFGLLTVHVLVRMAKTSTISRNIIYAAVNGYLLIGLIGGMGFRLISHFYPKSFVFSSGLEARIDDLTYFSFVTLSSLGYGDITPVTPPGQSLAIFISICGQLYTAIVIGLIIGKYILQKQQRLL